MSWGVFLAGVTAFSAVLCLIMGNWLAALWAGIATVSQLRIVLLEDRYGGA